MYTKKEGKKCGELWCVLEFNVQNLFSWQWLCLDFIDKDWCLRKVELKIARTHIEQITAKAAAHSGGNVMMTWAQQNFKQITMCLKPLSSSIWPSTQVAERTNANSISLTKQTTIGSMQNTVRWCSDWLDGAVVGHFFGKPWSNESDANVEDSDCTVRMLLFFSMS